MNNLDDLQRALITVLRYYHQDQCNITALDDNSSASSSPELENDWENIQSQDTEPAFLNSPNDLEASLRRLIHEATQQNNTRLRLLQYIVDLVMLLNQVAVTDEIPVDIVALFDKLNHSLAQFFTHLQCLNQTHFLKVIPVLHGDQTVHMSGFLMSRSKLAAHLTSLVLEPLGIYSTTEPRSYMAKIEDFIAKQKTKMELVRESSIGKQAGQETSSESLLYLGQYDRLLSEHEQLKQDYTLGLSVISQLKEEKASLLDEYSNLLVYCKQLEQKIAATPKCLPPQQIWSVASASSIGFSRLSIFNGQNVLLPSMTGVDQTSIDELDSILF